MRRLPLVLILVAATGATAAAQRVPPVRPLGPVIGVSAPGLLSSVSAVRTLPGGRALVNDLAGRRVVLFDSSLTHATVVLDSTGSTGTTFGARAAGLIPFRGDSTLFVDPSSLSMLVIDPAGKVGRVMAAPRPQEVAYLIGGPFGTPVFDSAGRLIYHGAAKFTPPSLGGGPQTIVQPDSAPIVRIDIATRKLDTLAQYKVMHVDVKMTQSDNGMFSMSTKINPMQVVDDWAAFHDGTVAVVRGRDYHVDWIAPDGTHSSSPRIPFDWQRLTDSAKTVYIDSTRAAVERAMARVREQLGAGAAVARNRPGGAANPAPSIDLVSPEELPDYRPAFAAGAARADADGNLWIRTSSMVGDGAVYDVVNRKGELIDRVHVPRTRMIVGFGVSGIVYMAVLDGVGARLEEARVR